MKIDRAALLTGSLIHSLDADYRSKPVNPDRTTSPARICFYVIMGGCNDKRTFLGIHHLPVALEIKGKSAGHLGRLYIYAYSYENNKSSWSELTSSKKYSLLHRGSFLKLSLTQDNGDRLRCVFKVLYPPFLKYNKGFDSIAHPMVEWVDNKNSKAQAILTKLALKSSQSRSIKDAKHAWEELYLKKMDEFNKEQREQDP